MEIRRGLPACRPSFYVIIRILKQGGNIVIVVEILNVKLFLFSIKIITEKQLY